ncbi:MAG: hypothetical protein L0Z48_11790, partial [candidate division Zixibacteria bacterium]|nr:hypothetical protein [candidate division Zixibacteria bacterium]
PSTAANFLIGLTVGAKYLKEVPATNLPKNDTSGGTLGTAHSHPANHATLISGGGVPTDNRGWSYASTDGSVVVGCTHQDTKASAWSSW